MAKNHFDILSSIEISGIVDLSGTEDNYEGYSAIFGLVPVWWITTDDLLAKKDRVKSNHLRNYAGTVAEVSGANLLNVGYNGAALVGVDVEQFKFVYAPSDRVTSSKLKGFKKDTRYDSKALYVKTEEKTKETPPATSPGEPEEYIDDLM